MRKMESSSSSNKTSKSTGITFVLALSAALAVSGAAYGASTLNATLCQSISGVWTSPICTIQEASNGVASSDFKITKTNTLDVKGSLTINTGVTISNSGTIIVENVAGVTPEHGIGWPVGVVILGTLDNSGTITIGNVTDSTVGIATSISVSANDPPVPNPYLIVPGVLTNSGTITIQNAGQNQGINNLGVLNNSASGIIMIANSSTGSTGIRNERYIGGYAATVTNAGSMTLANSGDGNGRGVSNAGSFTNSATGTFTINASAVTDILTYGLRNNGSFTNYGTFINNRGSYTNDSLTDTWGSYNISPGAMINYGRVYVGTPTEGTGTFYNEFIMMTLGEITSYGVMYDVSGAMLNYGTIYNYGQIYGGGNVGICIDEPGSPGGSGC